MMPEEQWVRVNPEGGGAGADESDSGPVALTAVQERALQQLAAGTSIKETARLVGVGRRTVHRWLKEDANFAAAYNAWRRETVDSGRARVLAMTDLALDTVQNAMLQGNARVAVQVAKATGVMDMQKPGPTDPEHLARRRGLRKGKRDKALKDAERQFKIDNGEDPDRDWMKDAQRVERHIEWLLEVRREALANETPEARADRLDYRKFQRRSNPNAFVRLLELADAAVAAEAGGVYRQIEPFRNIPNGSVLYAALLAACATGHPIQIGDDERNAVIPATGALADPPPPPVPCTSVAVSRAAPARPPQSADAPAVQKACVTRVSNAGAPARKPKPYDPDAVDPLDREHWVDL